MGFNGTADVSIMSFAMNLPLISPVKSGEKQPRQQYDQQTVHLVQEEFIYSAERTEKETEADEKTF